jgi:hypothetical protein
MVIHRFSEFYTISELDFRIIADIWPWIVLKKDITLWNGWKIMKHVICEKKYEMAYPSNWPTVQILGDSANDIPVMPISLKLSDHIACGHSSLDLSLLALSFLSNNSAIILETVTSQSAAGLGVLILLTA